MMPRSQTPPPVARSSRFSLLLLVGSLCVTVGGAEVLLRQGREAPSDGSTPTRAANVWDLPQEAAATPPPPPGRDVLLVGNSHTYALPGLSKGQGLRPDSGATLIDELARRGGALLGAPEAVTFERLAYPNFLPLEMLVRQAQLRAAGYRPEVVVVGITWRNVVRGSSLRPAVRQVLEDPAVRRELEAALASLEADSPVWEAYRRELRRVETELEARRVQSHADAVDDRLTGWLEERSVLVGESAALRASLYRRFQAGVLSVLVDDATVTYAVVEDDLALNRAVLEMLLRQFHEDGARLLVYFAPERSDLPPLIEDPSRRREVTEAIAAWTRELDGVVLDARDVVPDRYWGWAGDTPDRSHFTEPGHQRLAATLVETLAAAGFLAALEAEDSPPETAP
jgi:hypothetical protein